MPIDANDSGAGMFSLRLSDAVQFAPIYCILCGGYPGGANASDTQWCTCGTVQRWAQDADLSVSYGKVAQGMYGLECTPLERGGFHRIPFWFCPACGERLHDDPALHERLII